MNSGITGFYRIEPRTIKIRQTWCNLQQKMLCEIDPQTRSVMPERPLPILLWVEVGSIFLRATIRLWSLVKVWRSTIYVSKTYTSNAFMSNAYMSNAFRSKCIYVEKTYISKSIYVENRQYFFRKPFTCLTTPVGVQGEAAYSLTSQPGPGNTAPC